MACVHVKAKDDLVNQSVTTTLEGTVRQNFAADKQLYQSDPKRLNVGYYLGFMEYRKKEHREAVRFFRNTVPSDDNFTQLTRFYNGFAMSALDFVQEGLGAE